MKNEYTTSEISLFGKTGKVTFQFLRFVESHYENLPFIPDVFLKFGNKNIFFLSHKTIFSRVFRTVHSDSQNKSRKTFRTRIFLLCEIERFSNFLKKQTL